MKEIFGYSESNIEIAVLSSDTEEEWLKIDYVIRLRTSEGVYELTAADYYYEALELMLINSDNNEENKDNISTLIEDIDLFRNWIYLTLISSNNVSRNVKNQIGRASEVLNNAFNRFMSGASSIKDVYDILFF